MALKKKPTKLPARTVVADDLVIAVDGVEYRPHAGEKVMLRGGRETMQDSLISLRAAAIQEEVAAAIADIEAKGVESLADEAAAGLLEKRAELQSLTQEILLRLKSRIVAWEWTDPEGEPYPSPPTVEILMALEREELSWLRSQFQAAERTEDEKKDDSSDST